MRAHCREAPTGSVLPFLTHVSGLSRGTKALVALAANIDVVAGIAPAGYLAEHFGRKRALIGGTVAYSHLSLLSGLAGGIGEIVARCAPWAAWRWVPPPLALRRRGGALPASGPWALPGIADAFLSIGCFAVARSARGPL